MKEYYVLAFYQFHPVADPHAEVALQKAFLETRDATSRIYISEKGINGQMSALKEDAIAYMEWMHSRPEYKNLYFKIHLYHEQVFPRLTIKYRRQLVAIDREADPAKGGEHVSPARWKEMLDQESSRVLLDVRNDYEWQLGHFEGATLPPCETFRDFDEYAAKLKETVDPATTPVMMYCTGGIRCELYSTILKERGFEKVYQLDGGIINYGLKEGSSHWLGKLFVFDDRLSVPISDEPAPVVGKCHFCQCETEAYYNCANMDCNKLFLACRPCLEKLSGCCQGTCQTSPRLRPYHEQNPHKPFRKWYNYLSPSERQRTIPGSN